MKDLVIQFPVDKFEKLIIDIGWESLDDWISFWDDKKNIQIIGLGDSPNDLPLLLSSDIKIVIPGVEGPNFNLLNQLNDMEFTLACEPNGYGWKNEINKLINKRELT